MVGVPILYHEISNNNNSSSSTAALVHTTLAYRGWQYFSSEPGNWEYDGRYSSPPPTASSPTLYLQPNPQRASPASASHGLSYHYRGCTYVDIGHSWPHGIKHPTMPRGVETLRRRAVGPYSTRPYATLHPRERSRKPYYRRESCCGDGIRRCMCCMSAI